MRKALARHNTSNAVVNEEDGKAVREGRLAGWDRGPGWVAGRLAWLGWRVGSGGGQGRVAGRVWWPCGGQGGEAGLVGWLAWW